MEAIREFVGNCPTWALWIAGSFAAEQIVQLIKRKWEVADSAKTTKLVAAAIVSIGLAVIAPGAGTVGGYLGAAIGIFVGAVAGHEVQDKTGIKDAAKYIACPDDVI